MKLIKKFSFTIDQRCLKGELVGRVCSYIQNNNIDKNIVLQEVEAIREEKARAMRNNYSSIQRSDVPMQHYMPTRFCIRCGGVRILFATEFCLKCNYNSDYRNKFTYDFQIVKRNNSHFNFSIDLTETDLKLKSKLYIGIIFICNRVLHSLSRYSLEMNGARIALEKVYYNIFLVGWFLGTT